ncbi:RET [Branchiostoma lanceolatum]|uniref:receptor protein-tyrosine kinase n=1 Tax=Branchiostoma lanceolatum TaxID=7740 RepID=A0A8J9Z5G2_BRALA|nr:RET [Branchiostoma lanceolatum]
MLEGVQKRCLRIMGIPSDSLPSLSSRRDTGTLKTLQDILKDISSPLNEFFVPPQVNSYSLPAPSPPAPTITGYSGDYLTTGSSITLTCTSTGGKPPADLSWYKGSTELSADYSSTMDNVGLGDATSVLNILALQPADNGGVYECRASQRALTQDETSQVTISVAFVEDTATTLTGYTAGTALDDGNSLTLTCTSGSSSPAAAITWSRDGAAVTGSNNQQQDGTNGGEITSQDLVISLQPQHNGAQYSCRATNTELGLHRDSSAVGPLNVRFLQAGTVISNNSPVTAGADLTLTCTSGSSNPAAAITWTRGGTAVTGSNSQQQDGTNGGKVTTQQLVLSNLQPEDNGTEVKCVATNSGLSQTQEDTVTVVVNYGPRNVQVTCSPTDPSDLREGGDLVCTCTADSNPAARYSWSYGTAGSTPASSPPTGAVEDQTAGTLTFSTLDRAHSGEYRCTATNDISSDTSTSITVDVKYAPVEPTIVSNATSVEEGDSIQLTCETTSNPPASYNWTKQSGELPDDARVETIDQISVLVIPGVTKDDSGTYICTASNAVLQGGTAKEYNLTVLYPASITSISDPVMVDEYDDVSLTCIADSNPAPDTFNWTYMNGLSLAGDLSNQGLTLTTTIPAITYQQAGTYTCTAGNGIGTVASAGTNVTVEYPPKFYPPPDPYPAAIGADVSMQCAAFAVPDKITFTWSKDGVVLTNSSRITILSSGEASVLSISGVVEGDYGTYNCTAENEKGSATTTRTLQPHGPPDSPTGLRVLSKNTEFEVNIIWTAGLNGGLDTTHTVQLTKTGADQWGDFGRWEQPASQQRRTFNVTLDLKAQEAGNYQIRIIASNTQGEAWSDPVDLKLEGTNQRLYGRMTRDLVWEEALKDTESAQFRQKAALWERNLDKVFSSFVGYEGSMITQFSQGSVVGDFEAVVAQSETQAAIEAFETQVNSGSVGDLTVVKEGSTITEEQLSEGDNTTTIIAVVVSGVVLLAIIAVAVLFVRRRKSANQKPAENQPNTMELDHVPDATDDGYQSLKIPHRRTTTPEVTYEDVKTTLEFRRNQLDIKEELGQGEFGNVYKAEAWKISGKTGVTTVAVKELKGLTGLAAATAFFKELAVLKQIGTHPNVVSFLGCCTDTDPFYLLLEYVSGGSLQCTLRTSRTQQTYGNLHGGSKSLSSRDLTKFAWDVAKGMSFLSSKKILHRDLATRNVLVSADRTCKVSDFGFSREGDEYERTTKTRLPVRWMAPESLFHRKYTTKSDVWAFGVLLWEIVTLGATPYPGKSKREVMNGVQQGYRMDKPPHCDGKLYTLMLGCWDADPARRPEFRKIQRSLDTLMDDEHDYIDLVNLDENAYTSLQAAKDEKY